MFTNYTRIDIFSLTVRHSGSPIWLQHEHAASTLEVFWNNFV